MLSFDTWVKGKGLPTGLGLSLIKNNFYSDKIDKINDLAE